MPSPRDALDQILGCAGRPLTSGEAVTISGADPVLPSNFLLGTAGAALIAAVGVAASDLWQARGGRRQAVSVDLRAAAVALRSDRYLRVEGKQMGSAWAPISGFYQTRDSRWVQLHCNFPHHRDGVLGVLRCEDGRDAVAGAVATWDGQQLEDALAQAGMCAGLVRPESEWRAHPQAAAIAPLPLFEIVKLGESAPEPLPPAARPLTGIRALDLTRVLAGPVATRTLAEHGADVLRVTAAHLPALAGTDIDTGHGKLATYLDLRADNGRETMRSLVREADVFCQAYRPGTLAERGFSPEAVAALRPGIVYATLSAYGHEGPWRDRRGFDSLVQTVSGIVHEQTRGETPQHLPAPALDYVSGYLLAYGTMVALRLRSEEGGSYLVRVSLAQTGRWIQGLGRLSGPADGRDFPDPRFEDAQDLMVENDSPFGRLRHIGPVLRLSETPPYWARAAVPLGFHGPAWPER